MKKLCCVIALAAISFGSVFAHGVAPAAKTTASVDTLKKYKRNKVKIKVRKTKNKDTTKVKM